MAAPIICLKESVKAQLLVLASRAESLRLAIEAAASKGLLGMDPFNHQLVRDLSLVLTNLRTIAQDSFGGQMPACDPAVLAVAEQQIAKLNADFEKVTKLPGPVPPTPVNPAPGSDTSFMGFLTKWGLWILLGYGAYRLVRKWTADEIPSHELPRYAGGTRRFRIGGKGFSYTSSR